MVVPLTLFSASLPWTWSCFRLNQCLTASVISPPRVPSTCSNAVNASRPRSDRIPVKLALVVYAASARHGPNNSIYIWLFEQIWEEKKSGVNKTKKVEGKN